MNKDLANKLNEPNKGNEPIKPKPHFVYTEIQLAVTPQQLIPYRLHILFDDTSILIEIDKEM